MRGGYVMCGYCKECGSIVPLLQKNKVPSKDQWQCTTCQAVHEVNELGKLTLWTRSTFEKKHPGILGGTDDK